MAIEFHGIVPHSLCVGNHVRNDFGHFVPKKIDKKTPKRRSLHVSTILDWTN